MKKAGLVAMTVLGIVGAAFPAMAISFPFVDFPSPTYILIYEDTDWLDRSTTSWTYEGTLRGGVTYKFVLIVPPGADFDIKIYDENGNLVEEGTKPGDADEEVYLTPLWTGPFTIVVYRFSGSGFYTLKVYRQL